ncbi:hypothetical protein N2152v2_000418 [Parachlorella kessleri]
MRDVTQLANVGRGAAKRRKLLEDMQQGQQGPPASAPASEQQTAAPAAASSGPGQLPTQPPPRTISAGPRVLGMRMATPPEPGGQAVVAAAAGGAEAAALAATAAPQGFGHAPSTEAAAASPAPQTAVAPAGVAPSSPAPPVVARPTHTAGNPAVAFPATPYVARPSLLPTVAPTAALHSLAAVAAQRQHAMRQATARQRATAEALLGAAAPAPAASSPRPRPSVPPASAAITTSPPARRSAILHAATHPAAAPGEPVFQPGPGGMAGVTGLPKPSSSPRAALGGPHAASPQIAAGAPAIPTPAGCLDAPSGSLGDPGGAPGTARLRRSQALLGDSMSPNPPPVTASSGAAAALPASPTAHGNPAGGQQPPAGQQAALDVPGPPAPEVGGTLPAFPASQAMGADMAPPGQPILRQMSLQHQAHALPDLLPTIDSPTGAAAALAGTSPFQSRIVFHDSPPLQAGPAAAAPGSMPAAPRSLLPNSAPASPSASAPPLACFGTANTGAQHGPVLQYSVPVPATPPSHMPSPPFQSRMSGPFGPSRPTDLPPCPQPASAATIAASHTPMPPKMQAVPAIVGGFRVVLQLQVLPAKPASAASQPQRGLIKHPSAPCTPAAAAAAAASGGFATAAAAAAGAWDGDLDLGMPRRCMSLPMPGPRTGSTDSLEELLAAVGEAEANSQHSEATAARAASSHASGLVGPTPHQQQQQGQQLLLLRDQQQGQRGQGAGGGGDLLDLAFEEFCSGDLEFDLDLGLELADRAGSNTGTLCSGATGSNEEEGDQQQPVNPSSHGISSCSIPSSNSSHIPAASLCDPGLRDPSSRTPRAGIDRHAAPPPNGHLLDLLDCFYRLAEPVGD